MRRVDKIQIERFRAIVWAHFHAYGRHDLPWRGSSLKPRTLQKATGSPVRHGRQDLDPYRIMVSEVMLQQTQVSRVLEKYKEFLKAFPTVHVLAKASLSDVLKVWSGLGYNRRGKFLRDAAIAIVQKHGGKIPRDAATLRTIPGIGPYTASAILAFAFNTPTSMIETNIRAAFIHHFFTPANYPIGEFTGVTDKHMTPITEAAAAGQDPREWHWALMDYGSYLKKTFPNPSRASAHHSKQSKFEGSLRQVRGAILKIVTDRPAKGLILAKKLPFEKSRIDSALEGLVRDGIIREEKGMWQIS